MSKGIAARTGIAVAIGVLAFLSGCSSQPDKAANASIPPKWKGAAYHIEADSNPPKPNPAGLSIPAIKFTANPEALEKRALLVIKFDAASLSKKASASDEPAMDQMIMPPVDISGAEGTLPADYMDMADKDLARLLGAYCVKGKVKISVAMARSSLASQATEGEVDAKRLSDWLPIEVAFKNPHPKC